MERVSPFDALVDAASGLHWATAVFELEEDSKVRRWRLWEAACDVDGKPVVRPSVQLQSKALLDADAAQRQQLEQALAALTPSACDPETGDAQGGGTPGAHHPEAMLVQLGGDNISLMPHQSERRILYHIPWQLRHGESRPLVGLDGAQTPLLSVRSASVIADADQAAYPNWLRDHLVIIGASYLESRDLYQTPLGPMPGALILIGIDDYDPSGLPSLRGAVRDVEQLRSLLTGPDFGIPAAKVRVLADGQATHRAILAALDELVQAVQPGEQVLIHFSGLGSTTPDLNGDAPDGRDRIWVTYGARRAGEPEGDADSAGNLDGFDLLDDELDRRIGHIMAAGARVVLITDAAYQSQLPRHPDALRVRGTPPDTRLHPQGSLPPAPAATGEVGLLRLAAGDDAAPAAEAAPVERRDPRCLQRRAGAGAGRGGTRRHLAGRFRPGGARPGRSHRHGPAPAVHWRQCGRDPPLARAAGGR